VKIKLNHKQIALLEQINAPYATEVDYDDDAIIALEDSITDYILMHEIDDSGTTPFGDELLNVHDYIVKEYDS
jgi:hypothetical protein